MAAEDEATQMSVTDYAGMLRRRWRILFLGALVGALLGLAYLAVASPGYSATARVVIEPTGGPSGTPVQGATQKVIVATEQAVVRSDAVARLAAERLGGSAKTTNLVSRVEVDSPLDSLALDITFTSDSADGARAGAQAFAESYLQYRQTTAEQKLQKNLAGVDDEIAAIDKELTAANKALSDATPNTGPAEEAARLVGSLLDRRNQLRAERSAAAAVDTTAGALVDPARRPASTDGMPPVVVLIGMIGLGLTLAFGAAIVRDRTDPRLRSAGDLASIVGTTPVNYIRGEEGPGSGEEWFGEWYGKAASSAAPGVAVAHLPSGTEAESYRRVALRLRTPSGGIQRFLLVTGAGTAPPEEVAANLAVTLGRDGNRVLLIWSNVREDNLATYFNVRRGPGLGEVLSGRVRLEQAVVAVPGCAGVHVLPVGSREEARDQLFRFAAVKAAIEDPQTVSFDVVILIAPSPSRYADALALAPQVDAVLVTVDTTDTDRRELESVVESLRSINAPVCGVVAL